MSDDLANVTVSYKMHSDRRFMALAELGGWTHGDACWRCVGLWSRCTALKTDRPSVKLIRTYLGPRGDALLVEADLAELLPDGVVRLAGAGLTGGDTNRFGWYEPVEQRNAAGGRARAEQARREGRAAGGRFGSAGASDHQRLTSDTTSVTSDQPASTSGSPASGFRIQGREDQDAPVLPRDPTVGGPVPAEVPPPPPPPAPTPVPAPVLRGAQDLADRRRRLIGKAWQLAGEAFLRIRQSGIDPTAPNGWAGLPSASTAPMRNLVARLDEMLVGESPDFAAAEARIANRILVAEAEARALDPPTSRFMTPARMWHPESFSIGADMSPEQAATPMHRGSRAGPRGSAERAPKRDVRVGRIEPSDPSAYHETTDEGMPF